MINAIPSKVYVMRGPHGMTKVGRSVNPARRAKNLSSSIGGDVEVVYQTEVRQDASVIEAFALSRVCPCKLGRPRLDGNGRARRCRRQLMPWRAACGTGTRERKAKAEKLPSSTRQTPIARMEGNHEG
jgi:hypothetical protein